MTWIYRRAFPLGLALAVMVGARPAGALLFEWDVSSWPGPPGSTLAYTYNGIGNGSIEVTINDVNGSLVTSGSPASPDSNSNLGFVEAPEPETIALLCLGLLGLAVAGRVSRGNKT